MKKNIIYTAQKNEALVEMLSSDFMFYFKMPQVREAGEQNL